MFAAKKKLTRSPIKHRALPMPGRSLMLEYLDINFKWMLWWFPVFAIALLAFIQWYQYLFGAPPTPVMYTIAALLGVAIAWKKTRPLLRQMDNILLGLQGERVVAQRLETLRSAGYHVFHDIEDDRGNIDHVLIGPGGIFTIETKTISKPTDRDGKVVYDGKAILVDGRSLDRDPIPQVMAQSKSLRKLLHDITGTDRPVQPVVVFEGWYVTSSSPKTDVWVRNAVHLVQQLGNNARTVLLQPEEIHVLQAGLERHVRMLLQKDD